ncbi:3702_t:CDS:2, partial [Funneliformis geosporum]
DRLGNLGVIDDKYDVAISTACFALNNIVVDSVEVGQTCVKHLRKNNLGRVTFILLNNLPTVDMQPIQTPENVPRLFDLVKPKDEKFIPAFYNMLQNTLVAENLQKAIRIAFDKTRWRIMTLNGELVDKSGTMSGNDQVLKASDITPEIIAQLERERNHLEAQCREFNEKLSSLESQLQEKKDKLPKLEFELSNLEICADVCVKSITDNETSIVKLRQKEIKILQDKILEIGGDKLRAQKSKIEHVKDQIVLINERITKSQVAKSRAEKEKKKFENSLANSERGLKELNNEIENITKEIQQKVNVARSIQDLERNLTENKQNEIRWRKSLSDLTLHEIGSDEVQEFQIYTDDELDAMDKDTLQEEIDILKKKTENANPNLNILEEYNIYEKEYKLRQKDFEDVTFKRNECKENYDNLRKQRLDEFMHGFDIISQKLKEMYKRIVCGGIAELECDSFDPFCDGVIFSVKPPKKSWKKISDLSGGEKTLCSLSLVLALHHYKPTPICVMDEIDAALDFRNVSIVADYIKERTRDVQFIVISLHNNMYELADHLVGVFKTGDQSKSVTINPRKFQEFTMLGEDAK